LVLKTVGLIWMRMLQPAVGPLRRVPDSVLATDSDNFKRINTAGSLCVRRVRNTQDRT